MARGAVVSAVVRAGGFIATTVDVGDGSPDGAEVAAGTDPTDRTSRFAITDLGHNPLTGETTAVWSTVPGKTYQLQYTTDLSTGSWQDLGAPQQAVGATLDFTDPSGDRTRIYRAVVVE